MRGSGFNYGRLMQRALRGLMAEVLGTVAKRGLPGAHHFFISFNTAHPGVDMPEWLRQQYPEELSIILQHEFSDLAVANDRFSVALSFGNRLATLVVPFDAVTTFADPSENFGLKFDASDADHSEDDAPAAASPPPPNREPRDPERTTGSEVVSLSDFRKK